MKKCYFCQSTFKSKFKYLNPFCDLCEKCLQATIEDCSCGKEFYIQSSYHRMYTLHCSQCKIEKNYSIIDSKQDGKKEINLFSYYLPFKLNKKKYSLLIRYHSELQGMFICLQIKKSHLYDKTIHHSSPPLFDPINMTLDVIQKKVQTI